MKKILVIFGTRPEAIKMAPVVKALQASEELICRVCVTAQHREMLDQVLDLFKIKPDYDLDIMRHKQSLSEVSSSIISGVSTVLDDFMPDVILVHGDTTTSSIAALAGYYKKVDIGHVEAGLRTGNIYSPWPEEGNRKLTSAIAKYHFAPTDTAKNNLTKEGINPDKIYVTGNTVIDALLWMKTQFDDESYITTKLNKSISFLEPDKKLILVTGHRRENFGEGIKELCNALLTISLKYPDIQIVYPLHMNPNVHTPVHAALGGKKNIFLIPPQSYDSFVYLMTKSYLILTDSGGIQEEAPSLGVPVLVFRDTTERPEAIAAGGVRLVGADTSSIISNVKELLEDQDAYLKMSNTSNPYGNGFASNEIAHILANE